MMAQLSMATTGQGIMLIGLFVQLVFLGFFVVGSLVFWQRIWRSSKQYAVPQYGKHTWIELFKLVAGAAFVTVLRCILRIMEFVQGHSGYLVTHEVYMYIFDTAPMLGCRTVGCGGCRYGISRRVCMLLYCFSIIAQLISRSLRDTISNTV
jgi:hypothetical protein